MIHNIHSLQRRIEASTVQGILPFLLVGCSLIAAGLGLIMLS
jgi:hypothetical protein